MSGNAVPEVKPTVKVFRGDGFVRYSVDTGVRLYEAFTYTSAGQRTRYALDCTPVERLPAGLARDGIETAIVKGAPDND